MPRKKQPGASEKPDAKVGEAKLEYVGERRPVYPSFTFTKLSSKNQITLPVAYVRDLGLKSGDEVVVWLEKGHITLERRLYGKELLDSLQGSMRDPDLKTKEDVDAWVRALREDARFV
jgi:AbrB family looped-hinge helix DNA binding protein